MQAPQRIVSIVPEAHIRALLAMIKRNPSTRVNTLYSLKLHGPAPVTFHHMCDGKSPLFVYVVLSNGYVVGGYSDVPFTKYGGTKPCPNAFLWRLVRGPRARLCPIKMAVRNNGTHAIYDHVNYGPTFGNYSAFDLFLFDTVATNPCCYNTGTNQYEIPSDGGGAYSLTGGQSGCTITELEVLHITDEVVDEEDWIPLGWDEGNRRSLIDSIRRFDPTPLGTPRLNIVLFGVVGAGKSSFINSASTATTGVRQHCAIPGIALKGSHTVDFLPHNFDLSQPITARAQGFRWKHNPGLEYQAHVIVACIDVMAVGNDDDMNKLAKLVSAARDRRQNLLVFMTGIDKRDEQLKGDVSKVSKSSEIRKLALQLSAEAGIPFDAIFPIKNYTDEMGSKSVNLAMDVLVLSALNECIKRGSQYLHRVQRGREIDRRQQPQPQPRPQAQPPHHRQQHQQHSQSVINKLKEVFPQASMYEITQALDFTDGDPNTAVNYMLSLM